MLNLVRQYHLRVYLLDHKEAFTLHDMDVAVCAEGPAITQTALEQGFALLNESLDGWLQRCWHRRCLIYNDQQRQMADRANLPHAYCPLGTSPQPLAEYLLLGVFEPILRSERALVRDVEVRVPGLNPGISSVEAPIAQRYEAEMGLEVDDVPGQRICPFPTPQTMAAGDFGARSKWSRVNDRCRARP